MPQHDAGYPGRAQLTTLARRYRADPDTVRPARLQGVANHVHLLGDALVLRVARHTLGSIADLRKEATVIPAATRADVSTPELVDFDDTATVLDTPFMVLRRVPGVVPALPDPATDWAATYRDLGAQLRLIHDRMSADPSLRDTPADPPADPRPDVTALASAGYFGTDVTDWLIAWFDRLAAYSPPADGLRFTHGDACPTNLLADPDTKRLNAVLDWGDSGWADPATEFAKLPPRAIPPTLDGYLDGADPAADDRTPWAARILWHHLHWALGRIGTPPRTDAVHWSAPPYNRLFEIIRFLGDDPPEPWPQLA